MKLSDHRYVLESKVDVQFTKALVTRTPFSFLTRVLYFEDDCLWFEDNTYTVQINFQAVDVNKYRYIQTPIGLLIFEVIGHVYAVQCQVSRMNSDLTNMTLELVKVKYTYNLSYGMHHEYLFLLLM